LPQDELTPIARTTLTADIYRKLVGHIIRGVWKPGARIPPERQLGQLLGVGRASLREALKALEIMGLIETRLGDGTYVCQRSEFLSRPLLWAITSSSETEIHELVEARKLIETELAALAAERATADDLKQIGAQLDRMEHSLQSRSEFLQADIEFHLAIGQAAHNRILMNALNLIRNLLQEWIGSTLQVPGVSKKALEHHKAIFFAIAKKNVSGSRAAMMTHLDEMARFLLRAQQQKQTQHPPSP
jgi:GntR family transcriptional regulator, transcriptional repressor for pyruvate dehydrogenase complex